MSPDAPVPRPSVADSETVTVAPGAAPGEALTLPPTPPPESENSGAATVAVPGYEVLSELGRGGMGVVYKARQLAADRIVALKMILSGGHAGAADLARFRTEAQAVARLQHPGIVQVFEVGEHQGLPYFSLEFVDGSSLDKKLNGTPLPPHQAARLVEQAAEAMHAAHRQHIVHRDLKPANILLTTEGQPKVTDFGLAKTLDVEQGHTATGAIVGTPSYMAPEQAGGRSKEIGPAADVYALGAVLYECLTGRPPFKAATPLDTILQAISDEPVPPRQLQPKVPRDLETICLKCLRKEPARRYVTAAELAEDLRRCREGEPIRARRTGTAERLWRWCKRNPALAGLAAAVILSLLLGTAVSWYLAARALANAETAETKAAEAKANADLARTNEEKANDNAAKLKEERDEVRKANDRLHRAQEQIRRALYFSQMQQAHLALEVSDLPRARELLDRWRPKPGETDLRSFEWDYLRRACHTDRLTFVADPMASSTMTFTGLVGGTKMCYSPDGKRLATAWTNGLRVHDAETGKELLAIRHHREAVGALAWGPDGKYLAAAMLYGYQGGLLPKPGQLALSWLPAVTIFNAQTGQQVRALAPNYLLDVCFSPDGKRVATLSADFQQKNLQLDWWHVETGEKAKTLKLAGDKFDVQQLLGYRFSRDGKRLTVPGPNQVRLLDAETAEEVRTLKLPAAGFLVALNADGSRLADVGLDGTLTAWDAATGGQLFRQAVKQSNKPGLSLSHVPTMNLGLSADGKLLAVSWDQTVRLLDARTGIELAFFRGHQALLSGLAFRPDGQRIAAMSFDGKVKVWDVQPADAPVQIGWPRFKFQDAHLSADGRLMAGFVNFMGKRGLRVVEVPSRRDALPLQEVSAGANGLVFSPDGGQLAFLDGGGSDPKKTTKQVRVWDLRAVRQRIAIPLPDGLSGWGLLAFSPDGDRLALSGDASGRAAETGDRVWDLPTGKEILSFPGDGRRQPLAFSPNGKRLACGFRASPEGPAEVRIWDLDRGRVASTLKAHAPLSHLVFSPDGKRLAAAGLRSHNAELWDLEMGQRLQLLKGHLSEVVALAFSRDGKRLATSDFNGHVKLWDVGTGEEVLTLPDDRGARGDLAFTADGRLLRGNFEGRVKTWDARPLPPEVETQEQADALVSGLIREVVAKAEVLDRLKANAGLRAPVRQAALDIAERYREDVGMLSGAAWKVVKLAGRSSVEYRLALRQARAACAMEPENGAALTILGAALHRAGQYAEAVDALTRADKINAQPPRTFNLNSLVGPSYAPAGVAFLAMAQHQLGRTGQAQASLSRLRELIKKPPLLGGEDTKTLLAEAEAVLKKRPAAENTR